MAEWFKTAGAAGVAVLAVMFASHIIRIWYMRQPAGGRRRRIERIETEHAKEREEARWIRHRLHQLEERKAQAASEKRLEEIVDEKRTRFLKIPNVAFHFVDEAQIQSFYEDYFKEPTIASLVSEITTGLDTQVKGSVPKLLEAKLGTNDLSKWVSTIKVPSLSLGGMFLQYQREAIKNQQVTLGLEEVDIELAELQAFEEMIDNLRKRFDMNLDDQLLSNQRKHLNQKAAERTLSKLEQATGWILVEGRFVIERSSSGELYRCVYRHPVMKYLPKDSPQISIVVSIRVDNLQDRFAGNYAESIGKAIPLHVYGQVWQPTDRKTNTLNLQLTPLAIY